MHHPLDRPGGNSLIAYLFHDDRRPLERACLSGGASDPLHQERGQFSSVKAQRLPEGEKSPDGIWGNLTISAHCWNRQKLASTQKSNGRRCNLCTLRRACYPRFL